jgi:two-component system chemotaxis response regulator CheB
MRIFEIVAIGTSWGGQRALEVLLAGLHQSFPAAVAIVQHRGRNSEGTLLPILGRLSALPITEAQDKQPVLPGQVYFAPPDYHLLVEDHHFALSLEAPVVYARPSIDVLLESCATAYGERVVGVILTGASRDGAQGLAAVKACGGFAIVQDPETAESRAMCEAAVATTAVDKILPLEEIGPFLDQLCSSRRSRSPK